MDWGIERPGLAASVVIFWVESVCDGLRLEEGGMYCAAPRTLTGILADMGYHRGLSAIVALPAAL